MITNKYKRISIKYGQSLINLFSIGSEQDAEIAYKDRKELIDLYKRNLLKDIDLSKLKKVYFDPACKFPRFKLSEYTNIKRCLKVEKADAVIITMPKFNEDFYYEHIVFYSPSTDQVYHIPTYDIESNRCTQAFGKTSVTPDDVLNQLKINKLVESDCHHVFTGIPIKLNKDTYKSLLNMQNVTNQPFIIDTDLDKAISDTQSSPDKSDLDSIKEFLSSSDSATVELGMKLLLNYNVLQKACTIGLLILQYSHTICNTNAVNSVGFKNLLTSLSLSKHDLMYFGEYDLPRYLKKLYEIATDEDDKNNARQVVIDIINASLKQRFNSYGDVIKTLNIKSEIKLY